jgi:hypothetical protein
MTTGGRSRFSVPPPRPIAWALAYTCWIVYAVLDFGPQVRDIIKVFPWSEWWGFDGDLVLQAGRRFLDGQPIYADSRFMYAPAAAVFGIAGALVPREYALGAYAFFKVVLAIGVTYRLTNGSWLSVIAVLTFLPFINDVAPGNFMVPITAAMAIATFGQPRRRSGIFLGIIGAAIPKPFLVPYFIWLLVYRRAAAEGAIATGALVALAAAVVAGPSAYIDWLHSLSYGAAYITPWSGNYGVSNYLPALAVPIAVAVMLLTLIVIARADENRSLAWVLAAGILVSPYAGPLEALPLLLALPILRPWPRVYAIAMLQPLTTISVAMAGIVALIVGPLSVMPASRAKLVDGVPASPVDAPVMPDSRPSPDVAAGPEVAAEAVP